MYWSGLLKKGGEVSAIGGFNNATPIISAIVNWPDINSNIRTKTVEILLNNGADINQRDSHGETPLMNAAHYGALSVVELLIKRGADVNLVDPQGRNAIIHTVQGAYDYQYRKDESMNEYIKTKILTLLTNHSADVNITPHKQYPAITHVIHKAINFYIHP